MTTIASLPCLEFSQNAWRPELCINCQRPRTEHPAASSSAASSITPPSTTATYPRRNSSSASDRSSSPTPAKRTSTILKSSTSTQAPRSKSSAECISSNKSSVENGDHGSLLAENSGKINTNLGAKTDLQNDSSLLKITTTSISTTTATTRKSSKPEDFSTDIKCMKKEKRFEISKDIHLVQNETANKGILSNRKSGASTKKKRDENRQIRVAFVEASPDIIGYDGGLDNTFNVDDDSDLSSSSSEGTFSFTDEEKYFALLALENTVWNSDAKNLLQDNPSIHSSSRQTSKEFEDLNLDTLCFTKRFGSLKDCDGTCRSQFGTFPLGKKSNSLKQGLDTIFQSDNDTKSTDFSSSKSTNGLSDRFPDKDKLAIARSKAPVMLTERSKPSAQMETAPKTSGIEKKTSIVISETSSAAPAYKVVNIIYRKDKDKDSYTVGDITECLYNAPSQDLTNHTHNLEESGNTSENSGSSSNKEQPSSSENSGSSSSNVKIKGKVNQVGSSGNMNERKLSYHDEAFTDLTGADTDQLNDSTTAAGLQVLALLNDVLNNYGENESSTDSLDNQSPSKTKRKEPSSGKKSDFEANMASVAASLDLSKQARGKRPAPRPPSSPPPEPIVSPKKKTQLQPEPVFKMVPVGKPIITMPLDQDFPRSAQNISQGHSFPSFDDLPENVESAERGNDPGRAKKGITSFFRNILRRGKDSSESFEPANPDIQFVMRPEMKMESGPILVPAMMERSVEPDPVEKKPLKSSTQAKLHAVPEGMPAVMQNTIEGQVSNTLSSTESENGSETSLSVSQMKTSSPPSTAKSKVLSSPKQILKRTAAKLSPPSQHKIAPQSKDDEFAASAKNKPVLASRKSDEKEPSESGSAPVAVRRRAKSPKRIPPPVPPAKAPIALKPEVVRSCDLARELEQRLSRPANNSGTTLISKVESQTLRADNQGLMTRAEIRRSMTVPPPSPPSSGKTPTHVAQTTLHSPLPEESLSLPSSPTSPTPPDSRSDEGKVTVDEGPRFVEKIELPTAMPGKKGFLGKLSVNRKSRAPAPPSVKRARSISDAEKRGGKRIDPSDISGPVLVTDITNTALLENRRNTISLSSESAFSAAAAPTQSADKDFDDLDLPILSPLGSLENLYESILPKDGSGRFPYYDPPSSSKPLCPNIPAEGYLEPVSSSSLNTASNSDGSAGEVSLADSLVTAIETDASTRGTTGREEVEKTDNVRGGSSLTLAADIGSTAPTPVIEAEVLAKIKKVTVRGEKFKEPELTEERRQLIASQPIYEEITCYNSNNDDILDDFVDADTKSLTSLVTQMTDISHGSPVKSVESSHSNSPVRSATLPHPKRTKPSEGGSHFLDAGVIVQSQSSLFSQTIAVTATQCMTSSMISALPATSSGMTVSPFMTASMTSSLIWHSQHSQPLDSNGEVLPLPPIPQMAPRSVSRETVSSESDTQSSGSTLSRPRPAPRRRPKRPDTTSSDQYVSMNRPNTLVVLGEAKLRETFSRLTAMNFQTLHDVYVQCERMLALEKISLPSTTQLKWADFDIYGQSLHASGRCVVYNAKLKVNNSSCQLMVLHSRPAAEMSLSTHPTLLRPVTVFADNVPFSFLTAEFIKTSQLLQNSVYDSCLARCFVAVGVFDVAESLAMHLTLLRETLTHDPDAYLRIVLMTTLQLLSAMSHCLDRGFTVTETDLGDVFLIARQDLRGKVVAFLPHQRAPDVPQGEAMCGFLDKLLKDSTLDYYSRGEDDPPDESDDDANLLGTVEKLRLLLEPRRIECLAHMRAVVEYLLWGPVKETGIGVVSGSEGPTPQGLESAETAETESEISCIEQDHCAWLERERALVVGKFARSIEGIGGGISLEDFYRLKFLLKSSATSLAECSRQLT